MLSQLHRRRSFIKTVALFSGLCSAGLLSPLASAQLARASDDVTKQPRLVKVNPRLLDIIQRLFAAGEAAPGDPTKSDEFASFFIEENPQYQFGNADTVVTREAIRDSSVEFSSKIKGLHHIIKAVWQPEKNLVLVQLDVAYYRFDGNTVILPVMDLFRFEGDLISELLIFENVDPVLA